LYSEILWLVVLTNSRHGALACAMYGCNGAMENPQMVLCYNTIYHRPIVNM